MPTDTRSNGTGNAASVEDPKGNGAPRAEAGAETSATRPARKAKSSKGNQREPVMNFIRAANTRERAAPAAAAASGPGSQAAGAREGNQNSLRQAKAQEAIPEGVRDRYVQDGRKWYHKNGDYAFTDRGSELRTRDHTTTIIRDFLAIGRERNWGQAVEVGGTKDFRREAWREAKLAGLEVIGYRPSRVEQALLIRMLADRQKTAPQGERTAEPQPDPPAERKPPDQNQNQTREAPRAARRAAREDNGLITGKLLEHKRAPHPEDQNMSYYVLLQPDRGNPRKIWGIDLERAIRQSLTAVQVGDRVGLRAVSREDFKLQKQEPDEQGRLKSTQVDAHRNGWIVEQRRFFDDRAVIAKVFRDEGTKPSDAVRRHPELRGTYLDFQSKKLEFEKRVKQPEDRAAFARALRERMADQIERGEPLKPVKMRQHAPQRDISQPQQANGASIPDPQTLVR